MNELEKLQEQIESLEKRIASLERIINGTSSGKVGRKPKLMPKQKQDIIKKILPVFHIQNSQRNIPYPSQQSTIFTKATRRIK